MPTLMTATAAAYNDFIFSVALRDSTAEREDVQHILLYNEHEDCYNSDFSAAKSRWPRTTNLVIMRNCRKIGKLDKVRWGSVWILSKKSYPRLLNPRASQDVLGLFETSGLAKFWYFKTFKANFEGWIVDEEWSSELPVGQQVFDLLRHSYDACDWLFRK